MYTCPCYFPSRPTLFPCCFRKSILYSCLYSIVIVIVIMKSFSHVRLFVTPWTVAYQAPPSMGFSRQEYWSGLPFPSPGDLPNPGIEPRSPTLAADALTSEPPGKPYSKVPLKKEKEIMVMRDTCFSFHFVLAKCFVYLGSTK